MSHWQGKTKRRTTDIHFSKYIRMRDKKCVLGYMCTPRIQYNDRGDIDISYLDCSHFHGRRKESTRFDTENADALCKACHNAIHSSFAHVSTKANEAYEKFKLQQLGQQKFDILLLRSNTPGKRDDVMQKIINKELLKEIV